MENNKNRLLDKVLPILNYIGIIGAIIMSIAYIVIVFVLINGFKAEFSLQTTVFAFVNAGVGFIIMQFLKYQGVSFAKMLPDNQEVINRYYKTKTKDKKIHSISYFWVTSVIKDVIVKCATLGATTIGIVYIVIQGSNDYNLLLLAFVNLLMFVCFGFISLNSAYEFFNNRHVPYMVEMLNRENAKINEQDLQVPQKEEKEINQEC
ncbi:MAG: hypothetical protein J6W64_04670 [Bacilli bacterium]|nr:hypothetical protein [Bacilli bacterium]